MEERVKSNWIIFNSGFVFDVATPRTSWGLPQSRMESVRFRHQDGRGQKRKTEFPYQPQLHP